MFIVPLSMYQNAVKIFFASDYKARDAADLFGYIRGLDASEIVVYEDLYKLLTILTRTCIRIITEMEVKTGGYNEKSNS